MSDGEMILPGAEPFFLPGGAHGVLLIHGFTGLPAEMHLLGKHLQAEGFSVLGIRLAGHGTTAESLSRMEEEDWIDSVRDGYAILSGMTQCVSVVGQSMGGLYALRIAVEEKVHRVVTLAAPIFIGAGYGLERLPARELCEGKFYTKARKHLEDVPEAVNRTYRKMPLVSVHELLAAVERAKGSIERVQTPVLILHSLQDKTAEPISAQYIYTHVLSKQKTLIYLEKSGHLLPLDVERDLVFQHVTEFLKRD